MRPSDHNSLVRKCFKIFAALSAAGVILASFESAVNAFSVSSLALGQSIQSIEAPEGSGSAPDLYALVISFEQLPFPVILDLDKDQLRGTIPIDLIKSEVAKELQKKDDYKVKDTRYNKIKVNYLRLDSVEQNEIKVKFEINYKKYECINIFGNYRCTRLFSVTPTGTVTVRVAVRENKLHVDYVRHSLEGDRYYHDILQALNEVGFIRKQIALVISDALKDQLDGMNLINLLRQQGLDEEFKRYHFTLDDLVEAGVSINADINAEGIPFFIDLPKEIIIGG